MATNHKTTSHSTHTAKSEDKHPKTTTNKPTSEDGIPASRSDTKEETRLFQRGPNQKVWLTQDEAKNEGFFWEENPDENVNPPN